MNLIYLESMAPADLEALAAAGVRSSDELLRAAGSASGRAGLAATTGIDPAALLYWARMMELFGLSKLTEGHFLLLEALELGSLENLCRCHALDLLKAMRRKNVELLVVRALPAESQIALWIEEATSRTSMITA
jgi:hypothetical protein